MNEHTKARRSHLDANQNHTYDCGCIIRIPLLRAIPPTLIFCPIHAAAEKLLEACKGFMKFVPPLVAGGETSPFVVQVRDAIAEAEPK